MCESRRPANGADSRDWQPAPWQVLVEEYDGGRVTVTVNAIGRYNARDLGLEKARDLGYDAATALTAVEVAA